MKLRYFLFTLQTEGKDEEPFVATIGIVTEDEFPSYNDLAEKMAEACDIKTDDMKPVIIHFFDRMTEDEYLDFMT